MTTKTSGNRGAGTRQLLPRAERQAAILVAAASAFADKGFAATSMDDVAAEAGVTKLIVYRHFDSKEDLYRAVLKRVSDRLTEEFLARLESGRREGIGIGALLAVARENPAGFNLLWRHAPREPQFVETAREMRDLAATAARAMLATVFGDPMLLTWAAESTVGYLVEAVLTWLESGDPARDDEMAAAASAGLRGLVGGWTRSR